MFASNAFDDHRFAMGDLTHLCRVPRLVTVVATMCIGMVTEAHAAQSTFTTPTGPYRVGVIERLLIDSARGEIFTADTSDRRHVLVRIWYPVSPGTNAAPARYITDLNEFGDAQDVFAPAASIETGALHDAPPATGTGRFPVLLFSHGYGWPRFSSSFVTEWMASHGYVVFGINHTGSNQSVRYPNGYRFRMDANQPPSPTGDGERDAYAFWDYLTERHVPVWRADMQFVLSRAEEMNRTDSRFRDRFDLDRVGAFGWSFGGAMSVDASQRDRRVKAAVDLDGQLFGPVIETGTRRPVLLMHSTNLGEQEVPPEVLDRLIQYVRSRRAMFLDRSTGDWYDVNILGTQHGSFSDLVLFSDRRLEGELEPRRAHLVIQTYTQAFFDHYLRGRETGLLNGPSDEYPEAEFIGMSTRRIEQR